MQTISGIFKSLKTKGFRFSKIRAKILDFFITHSKPLSPADVQGLLAKHKTQANKTTVYRELDFLVAQKIIRELRFRDGTRRYEITPSDHHHHIVCVDCNAIEHISLEKDLEKEEKIIAQKNEFKVLSHSLEFYGLCSRCK